jgi:hypothetical protein
MITRFFFFGRVIGATRSVGVLVSELHPLLAQNNILVQYRAPKRADPDQPTALSLASAGGRNLDVCACFLGSMNCGEEIKGFHMMYCGPYSDNLSTFTLLKQIAQIPQNLLLARVKRL